MKEKQHVQKQKGTAQLFFSGILLREEPAKAPTHLPFPCSPHYFPQAPVAFQAAERNALLQASRYWDIDFNSSRVLTRKSLCLRCISNTETLPFISPRQHRYNRTDTRETQAQGERRMC